MSWALATITVTSKKPQLMGLFRKECECDGTGGDSQGPGDSSPLTQHGLGCCQIPAVPTGLLLTVGGLVRWRLASGAHLW